MEYVNCPICGKNQYEIFKTFHLAESIDTFKLVKCKCEFIFLNPRPNSLEIKKYYDEEYLPHMKPNTLFTKIYNLFQKITFKWKLNIIKKNIPNYSNVLDIGGGNGDFASYLNNKNITATNYEPNLSRFKSSLEDFVNNNVKFDLIMFWHSLEHIHNINETLVVCDKLLNKDGRIIIAIPNHDAYERKFFKDSWIAYDIPRHLYHFNYTTFKNLAKLHDFNITKSFSMYQDTLFNILLSFKSYNIFKFIYIVTISLVNIIVEKNRSSSLLYICKKI